MSFRPNFNQAPLSLIAIAVTLLLTACGGGSDSNGSGQFKTLDGRQPMVIAHRGASGYFPEHTREAYTLAIAMGADVIEPDLVPSKDGILIARHDITLSASTNVADHPEFAARKRAGENGDGEAVAADWFVSDFTLAELKTLRARSPNHAAAQVYNNQFGIITFQDVLDLVKAKSKETGRTIAVYPETKNPSYHLALFKAGKLPARMEDTLLQIIKDNGLNSKDAPVFVQSFEPGSLKYMRSIGSLVRQVFLIDAYDIDFKTGAMIYGTEPGNLVYSQPTDLKLAGDKRLFDWFLSPAGLAEVKTFADGIGPWKPMILPVKCTLDAAGACKDMDGDGSFNGYADSTTQAPTTLVADAHKAGLFVHEYTFRSEKGYYHLPLDARGDPGVEYLQHFRLGVDGVFSDQADHAIKVRADYVKETGVR